MANRVDAPLSWQADQFTDLSGSSSSTQKFDNPYDVLIHDAGNDATKIQERYSNHRTGRNAQQKAKLLADNFPGVSIDPVLEKLVNDPSYKDPRYCLVFWARPTQHVRNLIDQIQQRVLQDFPNMWLMPLPNLHMTTLEITHSRTKEDEEALVAALCLGLPQLPDYTATHRARLVKPLISFDGQAFALSYVPAAGESLPSNRSTEEDSFTYHHLRRDMYSLSKELVEVDSRYTIPSAHLTVGRYLDRGDFGDKHGTPDPKRMARLVEVFEKLNGWLQSEYWPIDSQPIKDGGEWIVGEEQGLDFRHGTLWYGGGETVCLGKGF